MGMLDYNLELNMQELETLKKLLLFNSLYDLDKGFKKNEVTQLHNILKEIEKILRGIIL